RAKIRSKATSRRRHRLREKEKTNRRRTGNRPASRISPKNPRVRATARIKRRRRPLVKEKAKVKMRRRQPAHPLLRRKNWGAKSKGPMAKTSRNHRNRQPGSLKPNRKKRDR